MNSELQGGTPPRTLSELMAQALVMELASQQRYRELADAMESANNHDVAELFRSLEKNEGRHARQIMGEMGWKQPADAPLAGLRDVALESPGVVPTESLHYLMQPWHALQLALEAEERAERFFGELAQAADGDEVRSAALALQAEEAGHVSLIRQWLDKTPQPDPDWAHDPDPPRYTD